MKLSLILGWWAFPKGPFYTIKSIKYNRQKIKETYQDQKSEDFYRFIHLNRDFILENRNSDDELLDLISSINAR